LTKGGALDELAVWPGTGNNQFDSTDPVTRVAWFGVIGAAFEQEDANQTPGHAERENGKRPSQRRATGKLQQVHAISPR
jgi:hypothetical protein